MAECHMPALLQRKRQLWSLLYNAKKMNALLNLI